MTIKLLMSACLVGQCCRWDAKNGPSIVNKKIHLMLNTGEIAVICPECAAGLDVPREPSEIAMGFTAQDVLDGTGRVFNRDGTDATLAFVTGAQKALALCEKHGITVAVLKSRSPSCGTSVIHNGAFDGTLINGMGVTAALLAANGIRVFDETQIDQALALIDSH